MTPPRQLRPRRRLRRSRSSSPAAATRLSSASSPVSTGPAAMSPVSRLSLLSLGQSNLGCCMSCSREPCALACWSIPTSPPLSPLSRTVQAAALSIGKQIEVVEAPTGRDIDAAFARLAQKPIDALLVGPGPLLVNRRLQLATLAAYHRMPAIHVAASDFVPFGIETMGFPPRPPRTGSTAQS